MSLNLERSLFSDAAVLIGCITDAARPISPVPVHPLTRTDSKLPSEKLVDVALPTKTLQWRI